MYPRGFTAAVPAAGIKTNSGEGVAGCFQIDDQFRGGDAQNRYRSHKLGEPGAHLHTPGIMNPDVPLNLCFGKQTPETNCHTSECLKCEQEHQTDAYARLQEAKEAQYHRSKNKLGQVPDGVAQIPDTLKQSGFGISTRFGESAGAVVQGTLQDEPLDPKLKPGYQTQRNYNWTRVNPVTHSFGIVGVNGNVDHLTEIMSYDNSTKIVGTAVDRYDHGAILPDPNPLTMKQDLQAHTMRADQLREKRDPASRPPAGISTNPGDFSIGDTFAGMGCMDSFDNDYSPKAREYNPADTITHGIPTKPNPFPNPLAGAGRYINLGLRDEDFLKLRDKSHVVPVMVAALALTEEEAGAIFDAVAQRERRNMVSVSEFHEEFRNQQRY